MKKHKNTSKGVRPNNKDSLDAKHQKKESFYHFQNKQLNTRNHE